MNCKVMWCSQSQRHIRTLAFLFSHFHFQVKSLTTRKLWLNSYIRIYFKELVHKFMSFFIYDDYGSVMLFNSLYLMLMNCSCMAKKKPINSHNSICSVYNMIQNKLKYYNDCHYLKTLYILSICKIYILKKMVLNFRMSNCFKFEFELGNYATISYYHNLNIS